MFARPKVTIDGHLVPDSEKSFKQVQWRRHRQISVPIVIIVFALAMFGAIYLAETSRAAVTGNGSHENGARHCCSGRWCCGKSSIQSRRPCSKWLRAD